jgi:hypothetical protein
MILVCTAPKAFFRRFAGAWFCTLPVLIVIGLYLLVHLVDRFMLGFLLVLWGVSYSCVSVPSNLQLLARRALMSTTLVFAAYTMPGLLHYLASPRVESVQRDAIIAEAIQKYGVRAGDPVGVIGDGQEAYWAHWVGASVVSELWSIDSAPFWSGSTELQQAVLHAMKEAGAKAIVWRRDSDRPCPPQWASLPEYSGCTISLSIPR